ncbi:MAG TPA: hypothetical protein VFR27_06665 [Mycobacterium sp.]|nr:hypothetical protein [Mycobacterium sp.]
MATVDDDLDYAVINFDPRQVTPVANFAGFLIDGIGPDPGFLQPACAQGGATGFDCSQVTVAGLRPATITANMSRGNPVLKGRLCPLRASSSAWLAGVTTRSFCPCRFPSRISHSHCSAPSSTT